MRKKVIQILERFKSEKDEKKVRKLKERYSSELFFACVEIGRILLKDGTHRRAMLIRNYICNEKLNITLSARNTELLLKYKCGGGYTDYVQEEFSNIEEAESWVVEKIEEIKERLKEIKEEYKKHKKLKEEETIYVL